jgi:hypothetical protein
MMDENKLNKGEEGRGRNNSPNDYVKKRMTDRNHMKRKAIR